VRFLQAVAAITMSKTRTRLNLKKLYAADGAAVRELLKLAELLHKAMHTVSSYQEVSTSVLQPRPWEGCRSTQQSAHPRGASDMVCMRCTRRQPAEVLRDPTACSRQSNCSSQVCTRSTVHCHHGICSGWASKAQHSHARTQQQALLHTGLVLAR
jgi:hypothetical protein